MLSVSGILAVMDEPTEKEISAGVFFNFQAVAADPTNNTDQPKYHHYKVNLFVPTNEVQKAREALKPKKVLQIHHGFWSAPEVVFKEGEKASVVNGLKASWKSCTVLGWFANRKKD